MAADGTEVSERPLSLGEEVSELFGDYSAPSEAAPSEGTEQAGTDDTSRAAATDAPTDAPATQTESEPPGESPDDAPPAAPTTADADADPMQDAQPFGYTVDGQQKTYEHIKVLGQDGGIISPEGLADLQRRMSDHDHLVTSNQQLYRDNQHLTALSTWQTSGPDGKELRYTGAHGIMEAQAAHARVDAVLKVVDAFLADPAKFARLVGVDEKNQIVLNPEAKELLDMQARLAAKNADDAVRTRFAGMIAEHAKPPAPTIDYAKEAPALIQAVATGAKLDAAVLTAKDRELLATQLPYHTRDGKVSVDWQGMVRQLIEDRASRVTEQKTLATSAQKTGATNATRLAQAARGTKTTVPARRPVPVADEARARKAQESSDLWDMREKAAAAALRSIP